MKRLACPLCVVIMMALAWPAPSVATPVGPMNYQGRLLDNQGIPVTGNYTFTVRIYNDPVSGTLKYSEVHNNVAVNDGVGCATALAT